MSVGPQDFNQPLDIINRCLQHCTLPQIGATGEMSAQAFEAKFAYDKIRLSQLKRNLWVCATRRVVLRPVDTTSLLVTFPAWATGTTYAAGAIVTYNGAIWVSLQASNTGNVPGAASATGAVSPWDTYTGPVVASIWSGNVGVDTDENLPGSYYTGELVYKTPGDGTYKIYTSLTNSNANTPDKPDTWSEETMYALGDVVVYSGTNYQSLIALNFNQTPSSSPSAWTTVVTNPTVSRSWLQIASATGVPLVVVYPAGTGPVSDPLTRNLYRLPNGYLRMCPPSTKEGQIPWLGGPTGVAMKDWQVEGDYVVSSDVRMIMLRFVCNLTDVTKMDDMLCELLAAEMAMNIGPTLLRQAQAVTPTVRELMRDMRAAVRSILSDARTVNAIEESSTVPPDCMLIQVRY